VKIRKKISFREFGGALENEAGSKELRTES